MRRRDTAVRRGYGSRWQRARAVFLAEHPLCCYCERQGTLRPATVVDHIIPHKGDAELFWDISNWQALCQPCHNSIKQQEEGGNVIGCDVSGVPLAGWK